MTSKEAEVGWFNHTLRYWRRVMYSKAEREGSRDRHDRREKLKRQPHF